MRLNEEIWSELREIGEEAASKDRLIAYRASDGYSYIIVPYHKHSSKLGIALLLFVAYIVGAFTTWNQQIAKNTTPTTTASETSIYQSDNSPQMSTLRER